MLLIGVNRSPLKANVVEDVATAVACSASLLDLSKRTGSLQRRRRPPSANFCREHVQRSRSYRIATELRWAMGFIDAGCALRMGTLIDHLVSECEQRGRYGETERLGDLDVNDQLELSRLLDGEVGGLSPLQDLVHEGGKSPEEVDDARPVRH